MATAAEQLWDQLNARALRLVRVEAGFENKVLRLLQTLEIDVMRQLGSLNASSFRRSQLNSLLAEVRQAIQAGYANMDRALSSELVEFARVQGDWTFNALQSSTGLPSQMLTASRLSATATLENFRGAPLGEWLGRQSQGLQNRFADQVRLGMLEGDTVGGVMKRVKGLFSEQPRNELRILVRTAVQSVANDTYMDTWKANEGVVKGVIWTATLDSRTTLTCAARDNLRYKLDGTPVGHSLPWIGGPGNAHWGCRSISVPWMASWRELGLDIDEVSKQTRASMTGTVPADQKFETWLHNKGAGFQDRYLGKTRAKAWRKGDFKLRDLVNDRGRPLSLRELELEEA